MDHTKSLYNGSVKVFRYLLILFALVVPTGLLAGERVSATNYYVVNQELFEAGNSVWFWTEDNVGSFTVNEGPLESGFSRRVGSGFSGPSGAGVTGEGICIYGEGEDTFTMTWKVESFGKNNWIIVEGTGKYFGISGNGTTKTRVASNFSNSHTVYQTGKAKLNFLTEIRNLFL